MNKKILIIIPIFLLMIIALFFTTFKTEPNVPLYFDSSKIVNTPKTNETIKIILTNQGFEPYSVTVSKNTNVVWINNSSQIATVDSDPHPLHTSYSPLNLGEFNINDKLEFIFKESGEYSYHNHYNHSQGGRIIVK